MVNLSFRFTTGRRPYLGPLLRCKGRGSDTEGTTETFNDEV